MTQTIDQELHDYIDRLDPQQKKSLLDVIKSFLRTGNSFVEDPGIQEYNQELAASEAEIDNGNSYGHEDVRNQSKEWLSGK